MEDLKAAMRAGDETRRSVIRLMRSAVQSEEISKGKALDDAGVVEALSRMVRQYRDSIEAYRQANRADLVEREQAELAILAEYLPEQLSREELTELAREAIQEAGASGPAEKGKVMGRLMPRLRGKADGNLVNAIVIDLLESMAS